MRLLSAAAFICLAQAASADMNAAYLEQIGVGNYITHEQYGYGNSVESHQIGNYNAHTAYQDGISNSIESWQYGNGHQSVVEQIGDGNSAYVHQQSGPPIHIQQVGNGMTVSITR